MQHAEQLRKVREARSILNEVEQHHRKELSAALANRQTPPRDSQLIVAEAYAARINIGNVEDKLLRVLGIRGG